MLSNCYDTLHGVAEYQRKLFSFITKTVNFFRKRIYIPLFLVPQRIPRSSDLRSKRSLSQNLDCK